MHTHTHMHSLRHVKAKAHADIPEATNSKAPGLTVDTQMHVHTNMHTNTCSCTNVDTHSGVKGFLVLLSQ